MNKLTIIKPDDWHLHLRDSPYLAAVVGDTAKQFGRAIVMPNLKPPITNCEEAESYRQRILSDLPEGSQFQPLMTLYLTNNTRIEDIALASASYNILGAKLYPAGATTNSDAGVTHIQKIYPVLEAMQKHQFPLLIHGEATDNTVDIFDREKHFIDSTMQHIRNDFPELRIVFEHITTRDAVDFVLAQDDHVAATITPHHLLINRNAMFEGGIRPHHYCLPIAKREEHRVALMNAATGHSGSFFAGTDSAPHSQTAKESACGCAGIYSAYCAIELYAEAFELAGNFTHFEAFMSLNGPKFYRLPVNTQQITLEKSAWQVPQSLDYPGGLLIPFKAGETLQWSIVENE
ncbi:MAG: dihydroorotase [Gammaproteobacteria bacterium]|jgi:dihydroorotase